jgi:hypothetical protein
MSASDSGHAPGGAGEAKQRAAQISTESMEVSAKYDALVQQTRYIAGGYMRTAWNAPPLDNDAGMNITDIKYDELEPREAEYLDAMKSNLGFWRVAFRRIRT